MPAEKPKVAFSASSGTPVDREGDLEFFAELTGARSLARTARRLGVSRSAVSRRLQRLERRLGVQLVVRSARSFALTEAGELYRVEALAFRERIDRLEHRIRDLSGSPRGRIRLGTSVALLEEVLTPLIARFLARHPEIDIRIVTTGHAASFIDDRLDCLVLAGHPDDIGGALERTMLRPSPFVLCASRRYLNRVGEPETPEDLYEHACLAPVNMRGEAITDWHFRRGRKRTSVHVRPRCAGPGTQMAALARLGTGIARVPAHTVDGDLARGRLLPVMGDWQDPRPRAVQLVHEARDRLPLRTRLFVDHVTEALAPREADR
jgi:DNA-binding transcriptional LysR family regulator